MKSKHLFQIVVLLAILVSAFGTGQPAQAQSGNRPDCHAQPDLLGLHLHRLCGHFTL